mgnify:FL=1
MNGEQVAHIRPGVTVDEYGDEQTGATSSETWYIAPVWPRLSTEDDTVNRSPVVLGLSLALPALTEVRARDRFQVRGRLWEAIGIGADYRSPFSGRGLVVVALALVEG